MRLAAGTERRGWCQGVVGGFFLCLFRAGVVVVSVGRAIRAGSDEAVAAVAAAAASPGLECPSRPASSLRGGSERIFERICDRAPVSGEAGIRQRIRVTPWELRQERVHDTARCFAVTAVPRCVDTWRTVRGDC